MYIRVWESLVFKKQKWRKQKIRLDTGWGKKNRYKRHKRPKPQNPRMCYASLYVVLARCCLNGKHPQMFSIIENSRETIPLLLGKMWLENELLPNKRW